MKVIVLGGAGNFGARIVRALQHDAGVELFVAGRRAAVVSGAETVPAVALDLNGPGFAEQLRALSPGLVIHCAGPYQGQDYRVALAALAAGAHYLDIADGRQFVAGFQGQVQAEAVSSVRIAVSGASTLPGLSSAVAEHLRVGLTRLDSIEVVIAPGQLAPRGAATLAGVFSYLGRNFRVWREGQWSSACGWMDLRRAQLDIGDRWAAACDVPDLALFPEHFVGVQEVQFHAALEFRVQHVLLWTLAALRRVGMQLPVERWAEGLNSVARAFDFLAGDQGGMSVSVVGSRGTGGRVRRTWQLTAPALHGPEIPCMAAILLARRIARATMIQSAALPCLGLLTLTDFEPEFARWGINTRIEEAAA